MATKDSIMKQSIFFWVIEHRLSFEYGFKKFLFGAWRNLSGALRELILRQVLLYFNFFFFLIIFSWNTGVIRVSNSLNPDQAQQLSGLIWVHTVYEDYQQTTHAG